MVRRSAALALAVAALAIALVDPPAAAAAPYDESLFQALDFRLVGPFRGGRSTAVAGVPGQPRTFYMGTTGGGVWKTTDGGATWRNVSDRVQEEKPYAPPTVMGEVAPGTALSEFFEAPPKQAPAADPRARRRRLPHRLGGRHRGGAVRPQRRLRRHGLGVPARQRLSRRRRLQVHRRRRDLAPRRSRRDAAHHQGAHPPQGPRRRLRRRPRPRLRAEPRARRLPHHRRRPALAQGAVRERQGGRRRPGDGRRQSAGALRRHLRDAAPAVDGDLGRPRQRHLQVDRRRRHLAQARRGAAGRHPRPHRPRAVARQPQPRCGRSSRRRRSGASTAPTTAAGASGCSAPTATSSSAPGTTPTSTPTPRTPAPSTCSTSACGAPRTAAATSRRCARRTATTTTCGSTPTTRRSWSRPTTAAPTSPTTAAAPGRRRANQPTAEIYRLTVDDQFPYWMYGGQQDNTALAVPSRTMDGNVDRHHWYVPGGCESAYVAVNTQEPRRHLRRLLRRLHRPLRPEARPRGGRSVVAAGGGGPAGQGPALPLPVEHADPHLAARPADALRDVELRAPHARRGEELGGHQPRPDAQRSEQAGLRRRPHHLGQHRRRGVRHHLRLRGVAAHRRRAVGGERRRPGAPLARRRRATGAT